MEVVQREIMPHVTLTALRTDKFKSSVLSLTLLAPMDRETITENALLPSVLRRGSVGHPDSKTIAAALDELCGGSLEVRVRQQGEIQCVGFCGSFLDDAFSPDGSPILEPAARLMGELLLQPVVENGVFSAEYVAGEGKNLADRIAAQINEKRQYSLKRLKELMCEQEPYGLDKLGFADEATAISPEQLWRRYQTLLSTAPIVVYYCGSMPVEQVERTLKSVLKGLPERSEICMPDTAVQPPKVEQVRLFEDTMDVTQGKLALGWRTGGITAASTEYPALLVMNAVYGGTTISKLFMNVRERLSLCYFASSVLDKQKGLMVVLSGIEFDKYQQTKEEILAQLQACMSGDFTEQELEAARRAIVSSLVAGMDSQGSLEEYWLSQAACGTFNQQDELAQAVEQVTAEQVVQVAKRLELDSIYFLKGREE